MSLPLGVPVGLRDLAEPDLRSLLHHGNILDADRRARLRLDQRVFNLLHVLIKALRLHVDLLRRRQR